MNIKNLKRRTTEDTEELKNQKEYFNEFMKYDTSVYQLEVNENYFEIYDNTGKEIVVFATKDIMKILKEKKLKF
ncbi:MAG: hypothetical protein J6T10_24075 [Methanobrevibacter sp.]|nr:hypothetical protein [Methanobrevibacter sp.]